MKTYLLILLFFVSCLGFSQNNYIVKTDDGRRVLLKADYTWEYIDLIKADTDSTSSALVTTSQSVKPTKKSNEIHTANHINACSVSADFIEPELNSKIQSQLKRGRATIDDVKKKVAKDYNCEVEDVLLLSATEKKATAEYDFCANGTAVTYKRNGYSIAKKIKFF